MPGISRDDLDLTDRLRKAGEILGIKVLDHLIVTPEPGRGLCHHAKPRNAPRSPHPA